MADLTVTDVTAAADLSWAFATSLPQFRLPAGRYGHPVTVDRFPGYPHDPRTLRWAVDAANARIRDLTDGKGLRWPVRLFSGDLEETSRSNAHSSYARNYDEDNTVTGIIWLSGKRIPPHPAMTRHLVAHELGHNIEWMLEAAAGTFERAGREIAGEYAQTRGLPETTLHHGDGGTWHDSVHEIFACDFRVLVLNVEEEYWPHPGVVHPKTLPGMRDWWVDALTRLHDSPPAEGAETAAA